jgi:hypothetical protein
MIIATWEFIRIVISRQSICGFSAFFTAGSHTAAIRSHVSHVSHAPALAANSTGAVALRATTGDARHRVAMLQENVIGDKDFITPCREKCDGEFVRELGRQ